MYKRILIPLDCSRPARQVVPYAALVAKAFIVPVVLLEVLPKRAGEAGYSSSQEAFLAMLIARRRCS
jgi:nucleotide-binding universal stress UspA family protein